MVFYAFLRSSSLILTWGDFMKTVFLCLMFLLSACNMQNTKSGGEKVIGTFTTQILDTSSPRINNIELCIKAIFGLEIRPDEEFSFNDSVGVRSPEKGYQKATILVDGEREEGYGGGICQVASTLYNATESIGLKITERHNHSADVHYIEKGRDAAICYGTEDFKFINTRDKSVFIWGQISNGTLTMFLTEKGE